MHEQEDETGPGVQGPDESMSKRYRQIQKKKDQEKIDPRLRGQSEFVLAVCSTAVLCCSGGDKQIIQVSWKERVEEIKVCAFC